MIEKTSAIVPIKNFVPVIEARLPEFRQGCQSSQASGYIASSEIRYLLQHLLRDLDSLAAPDHRLASLPKRVEFVSGLRLLSMQLTE
jgi:hypothetical protein